MGLVLGACAYLCFAGGHAHAHVVKRKKCCATEFPPGYTLHAHVLHALCVVRCVSCKLRVARVACRSCSWVVCSVVLFACWSVACYGPEHCAGGLHGLPAAAARSPVCPGPTKRELYAWPAWFLLPAAQKGAAQGPLWLAL
jgi:hypothetical protein